MCVVVATPSRFQQAIADRLKSLPADKGEIILVCSDAGQSIPSIQAGDGLLVVQSTDILTAQKMAAAAGHAAIHYGEIALIESPLAARYGFMIAVGGKAADLHALSRVLDALSPCPDGWWHVGEAGSTAFLTAMLNRILGTMTKQVDFSNPLPQLMQAAQSQQALGKEAAEYLVLSEGEHFCSAHPGRHNVLASFIKDGADSPARQIARLICICFHPVKDAGVPG